MEFLTMESLATLIVLVIIGVWQFFTNRRHTSTLSDINDAVNQRHERKNHDGQPPPKLFDLAIDTANRVTKNEGHIADIRQNMATKSDVADLGQKIDQLLPPDPAD